MDGEYENSKVQKTKDTKMKDKKSTEKIKNYYDKEEKEKQDDDEKLGLSITDIIHTPNAFRDDKSENGSDKVSVVNLQENMNKKDDLDEDDDDDDDDEDEDLEDVDDDDDFDREYTTKKKIKNEIKN